MFVLIFLLSISVPSLSASFYYKKDNNTIFQIISFNDDITENVHILYHDNDNQNGIILGGINKFINITLNTNYHKQNNNNNNNRSSGGGSNNNNNSKLINVEINYPFNNISFLNNNTLYTRYNSKCRLFKLNSCPFENYIRVLLYDYRKSLHFVCSTRIYGSVCFYYNKTSNLISNIINDENSQILAPPTFDDYVYIQSSQNEIMYFATTDKLLQNGMIISFTLLPRLKYEKQIKLECVDPKFIYAFEKNDCIYFIYNCFQYEHYYMMFYFKGKIISICNQPTTTTANNNGNNISNIRELKCNYKIHHTKFSKYFQLHYFPIITAVKYLRDKHLLFVAFVDYDNSNTNNDLPITSVLCKFDVHDIDDDDDNNNESNGIILLTIPNSKITSITKTNEYLYLATNITTHNPYNTQSKKLKFYTRIIRYRQFSSTNNNCVKIEKNNSSSVYLPFIIQDMNIMTTSIYLDNSKQEKQVINLLFVKQDNRLIFFNVSTVFEKKYINKKNNSCSRILNISTTTNIPTTTLDISTTTNNPITSITNSITTTTTTTTTTTITNTNYYYIITPNMVTFNSSKCSGFNFFCKIFLILLLLL